MPMEPETMFYIFGGIVVVAIIVVVIGVAFCGWKPDEGQDGERTVIQYGNANDAMNQAERNRDRLANRAAKNHQAVKTDVDRMMGRGSTTTTYGATAPAAPQPKPKPLTAIQKQQKNCRVMNNSMQNSRAGMMDRLR